MAGNDDGLPAVRKTHSHTINKHVSFLRISQNVFPRIRPRGNKFYVGAIDLQGFVDILVGRRSS